MAVLHTNDKTLFLEDVTRIIHRRFEGKEDRYNREGVRNFSIIIDDPDKAAHLASLGWNVKTRQPKEDGDVLFYFLPVEVSYKIRAPKIVTLTNGGLNQTELGINEIKTLDKADILKADIVLNASYWEMNGKSGIKAYLKSLYVHLNEDPNERKYRRQV